MAALKGIPIKVVQAPAGKEGGGTVGGGMVAILREIAEMLERLVSYDESGAIDLRSLPFSPEDYTSLRDLLGNGEVEITMNVDGLSRCRETGYSGVWWIQHRNADDELVAELLEVATVPAIAVADREDITESAGRLKQRLAIHTAGRSAP